MLVQACVNGARDRGAHPRLPLTPAAIAADALRCARAGAGGVHVHPRDETGRESLDAAHVGTVCNAIRELAPQLPISVTTAAWIVPGNERLRLLRSWTALPDLASVNLGEDGALEVIELLNARGVGVEAGVWRVRDARLFVEEGLDSACSRVLVEIQEASDGDDAVSRATAIDSILDDGQVLAPRLHHGDGAFTWPVVTAAIANGHDVRIGLEDTLTDRDGRLAISNESLVRTVVEMARTAGRVVDFVRG